MRSLFPFAALCVFLAVLFPSPAKAQFITRSDGNGGLIITGYTGTVPATLNVPSTITNLTVTGIASSAFFGSSNLTSITIPSSVTDIALETFATCSNLTSITVSPQNSTYSSVSGVLFDKYQTTLIQYPLGLTSIAYIIPSGVASIGDAAFDGCRKLTSVTIPASITTIGDYAFARSGLTGATIPSGVTSIGSSPFASCQALVSVNVAAQNPIYSSLGGVLFDRDQSTLIEYPAGSTNYAYTIPSTVTSIGYQAFYSCVNLSSVTIPSSLSDLQNTSLQDSI